MITSAELDQMIADQSRYADKGYRNSVLLEDALKELRWLRAKAALDRVRAQQIVREVADVLGVELKEQCR